MQDNAADLAQLEATLRQPDAVLEPGVLGVLRRYVAAGGEPPRVVEALADGYVGTARCASLVVGWNRLLSSLSSSDPLKTLRVISTE